MSTLALRDILTDRLEQLLLVCTLFVGIPHVWNLETPVFLFFAALVGWRFLGVSRPSLLPGRWLLMVLTMAGGLLVFHHYHRFYGREGGAALLLVGLGLKLMEMRSRREVYLVVDLVFFVALTQYLFSQSIPMAAYTLLAVGLAVSVLIGVNSGAAFTIPGLLRRSAVMLIQALPMMLVLFLFFPRIAGPLWKLPDDGRSARSGLSDTMEPGSISRLGQSDEPAFAVDFNGPLPPPEQRYWRGPVFWYTDGSRWSLTVEKALPSPPPVAFGGTAYRYALTLEPHRRQWVFALELPSEIPANLGQTRQYLLLAPDKLADRQRFELVSQPDYHTGPLSADERKRGLQVPAGDWDRLRELVATWQAGGADPETVAARGLRYFKEQPFVYTLQPPLLADRPVERFLFDTRRGFCEHFSTSFVILMRLAGIPARVVTGYQGGQWNPVGRFLEVRQADAHAWTEIWLDEKGWTRYDPTAAVAPERIERGLAADPLSVSGRLRFGDDDMDETTGLLDVRRLWRESHLLWSSANHAWNRWVLSYDTARQKRFWFALGVEDWKGIILWLYGLLASCLIGVILWLHPGHRLADAPEVRLYRQFIRKLARQGVSRRNGEGPLDFARRATAEIPEASPAITAITDTFINLRYERTPRADGLARLRRLVRSFRP